MLVRGNVVQEYGIVLGTAMAAVPTPSSNYYCDYYSWVSSNLASCATPPELIHLVDACLKQQPLERPSAAAALQLVMPAGDASALAGAPKVGDAQTVALLLQCALVHHHPCIGEAACCTSAIWRGSACNCTLNNAPWHLELVWVNPSSSWRLRGRSASFLCP